MNAFISSVPFSTTTCRTSLLPSSLTTQRRTKWTTSKSTQPSSTQSATRMTIIDAQSIESATTTLLSANPAWIQKLADAVGTLNIPEPVTTYGHPAMMGLMVLGMGLPGTLIGWNGRLNENKKNGVQQKKLHENIMLAFYLLTFFGGFGGTLATAMGGYDIWQTPHAISALVVLLLLGGNSALAYSGFTVGNDGTPKGRLQGRKLHSYFGVAIMAAFSVHALLGVSILLG